VGGCGEEERGEGGLVFGDTCGAKHALFRQNLLKNNLFFTADVYTQAAVIFYKSFEILTFAPCGALSTAGFVSASDGRCLNNCA
jgi:hypothetical protein